MLSRDLFSQMSRFTDDCFVAEAEHPAGDFDGTGDTQARSFTLAYQGNRRFLSLEPIADRAPQISVRFSKPKVGEPLQIFVPLAVTAAARSPFPAAPACAG
jgi:hypothetical protein